MQMLHQGICYYWTIYPLGSLLGPVAKLSLRGFWPNIMAPSPRNFDFEEAKLPQNIIGPKSVCW